MSGPRSQNSLQEALLTEAMASPKRQTREAKLCFDLPKLASGFT